MAAFEDNHSISTMMANIVKHHEKKWDFLSICDWCQYFSIQTWEQLRFAYHHSAVKMHENTITQNLVFDFYCMAGLNKLPIMIFESEDEKANGNDLEIVIETNRGHVILPTQAKIVKKKNRYYTINHKNSNGYQIDLLIDYAQKIKGLPLYLFYNYCDDLSIADKVATSSGLPKELFGCSIADAYEVKAFYCYSGPSKKLYWRIPDFGDIHRAVAFPFHYLPCHDFYSWHDQRERQKAGGSINFYTREELLADSHWKNMFPAKIGFIPREERVLADNMRENEIETYSFNPRFRILISTRRI